MAETVLPIVAPHQVDCSHYQLFVNARPRSPEFVGALQARLAASGMAARIELARKSPSEMLALAAEPMDAPPDAILEEIVAGSTCAIVQFLTAGAILDELAKLESQYPSCRCRS